MQVEYSSPIKRRYDLVMDNYAELDSIEEKIDYLTEVLNSDLLIATQADLSNKERAEGEEYWLSVHKGWHEKVSELLTSIQFRRKTLSRSVSPSNQTREDYLWLKEYLSITSKPKWADVESRITEWQIFVHPELFKAFLRHLVLDLKMKRAEARAEVERLQDKWQIPGTPMNLLTTLDRILAAKRISANKAADSQMK